MSFISPDMPVQKNVEDLDTEAFIAKAEEIDTALKKMNRTIQ